MGVLDGTTLNVDAILTKKGRELLSRGQQFFNITQFALADDEIDYTLWNENHPSGSSFYGYAIETMPVLEAIPDETQVMRYKLVSLPKDTIRVPVINVGIANIVLLASGNSNDITPSTVSPQSSNQTLNQTLGYTAILHNSDVARIESIENVSPLGSGGPILQPSQKAPTPEAVFVGGSGSPVGGQGQQAKPIVGTTSIFLSDSDLARSVFVVGKKFRVTAKQVNTDSSTKITIIGNESGGSATISLTVNATPIV